MQQIYQGGKVIKWYYIEVLLWRKGRWQIYKVAWYWNFNVVISMVAYLLKGMISSFSYGGEGGGKFIEGYYNEILQCFKLLAKAVA